MVVFPNAKINLGLNVTGKRQDGYHDIQSVFYPVPFSDVLEIIENKVSKFDEFHFTGLPIPGDKRKNLIVKAIEALRKKYQIPALKVYLHKIIPMGGGLGGGSADGTYTLLALNILFDLQIPREELLDIALTLGSDCPFFVDNEPKRVSGRGELLQDIELDLSGFWVVLGFPEKHIGTKEAYQNVLISTDSPEPSKLIRQYPIEAWTGKLSNAFEPHAIKLHPEIGDLKEYFRNKGAAYASMTGSGSTVFGIFKQEPRISDMAYPFWKKQL